MTDDQRNQMKRDIEKRLAELNPADGPESRDAQNTISRLKQVLVLLDDPDYGDCTECGQPIGADRLVALPESRLCAACADQ